MFEQFKLAEQLEMEKTLSAWENEKYAVELMDGVMKSRGAADCCVGRCSSNGTSYQCFSLQVQHLPRFKAFFTNKGDQDCDMVRIWPTRGVFEFQQISVTREQLIDSYWESGRQIPWRNNIKWSRDFKFSEKSVADAIQIIDAGIDNVISAHEIGKRMKQKMEKMLTLEFEKIQEYVPEKKKKG